MKNTRSATAPMPRPRMHLPLSDPRLRFMTAGPEGGEGAMSGDSIASAALTGEQIAESAAGHSEKTHEDPPAPAQGDDAADDISSLPSWAQKQIRDLRAENAKDRTNAKQTAAQEARDALAQDIGKALGLVKDDNQTPDPDQLTRQVADAQAAQKQAAIELAIYKTATNHEGDPTALLDSRSFLEKVSNLDPSAEDFQTQIGDAIKQAVTDNPKLKTASQVPGRSGGEIRGNGNTPPAEQTPEALASLIRKKRTY